MLYRPGSREEREIIGPPVGRQRPATEAARRPRPQAAVAELGGKLDALTGLIERAASSFTPITETAPTPKPVLPQAPTAADLAKMSVDEFRQWSALRWSTAFAHQVPGGSPYSRSGEGPHPVAMPFLSDNGPRPVVSGGGTA